MVSTVWSVSSTTTKNGAPRAQLFVKEGAHAPVPYGVGVTDPILLVTRTTCLLGMDLGEGQT